MSAAAICIDDFARVAFAKRFARFIRKPRTVVCRSVPHVSFGSRNVKAARKGKRQLLACPTTAGDATWQQREKTKGSLLRDYLKCIANFNLLNKVKKKVSFFCSSNFDTICPREDSKSWNSVLLPERLAFALHLRPPTQWVSPERYPFTVLTAGVATV